MDYEPKKYWLNGLYACEITAELLSMVKEFESAFSVLENIAQPLV